MRNNFKYTKLPYVDEFIHSIWNIDERSITLLDYQILFLRLMCSEEYFIGEVGRQGGKSEMCLMYAVYMAMRNTNAYITIRTPNESARRNMIEHLRNRIRNLLMVKTDTDGKLTFYSGSVINFNYSDEDLEKTTHLIIDSASHFNEEELRNTLEKIGKYCYVSILSNDDSENQYQYYESLKKDKNYCYLRYPLDIED